MKLSLLILLVSFIRVSASVYSQQTKMSISLHHTSVHEVLKYIENQSEFFFLYKNSSIDDTRMIDIDVRNKSIDYILRQIFKGTKISFKIVDRQIVLMEEEDSEANRQKQQQKTITGIVTDSKGQVLPGVSVIEKNTNNGTMTDTSGRYTIKVSSDNSFLVFSFMGMKTIELAVAGKTEINVVMETGQVALDELVVIGYGSIRKKDLTGSVATVGVQDFQQGPITNAEQLIANKIPGVQITPISGKPGAGSSFLIRGGASLNASNDPLIVIDGVPIEGWGSGPGFLSSLNPDDIESFSILKDASAAAIYGSRASNGVILITTNKGAKGPLKFDFLVKTSLSTLFKKVPVLSADQYRQAAQEAATYTGKSFESLGLGNANTDWQDEIYQPALGTEYNLSVSGGLKKLPYRLSASYLNQDGILKTGNFKRTSVTLNLNPVLLQNHLKVNVNLKGASEKEQIADTRAISSAISFDPTQPVTTPDSHFGGYFEYEQYASNPANLHGHLNPVGMLEQESSKNNALRSIGNIQIDYIVHFLPDIHVNINTGYDMSTSKNSYYLPATAFEQNIALGSVYNADPAKKVSNTFFESYLNYVKEFKLLKSRVDAIVGYSYNNFLTTVYNYPTYNVNNQEQPNTEPAYPYDKPHHSLISFYGRLNYSFNNKYLLTATVRDDGSSRFSENNRWGVFPSFALAWKLNEESFLKNVKTISELKLRMGYGVTGQQDGIGNYDYLPMYTLGDNAHKYLIGNQFYQISSPSAADRNRKWEQTATTNIAL
ncbi:MAG TPA: SusC/RagA family TonB-linked outer membrane protein, partial [Bacteroidales bacterium]